MPELPACPDHPADRRSGSSWPPPPRGSARTFDDALVAVGGSRPLWLILISLKSRRLASQEELASAVAIRGATLTHHLDAMEKEGLVTRRRDPHNRRVHFVELTTTGDAAFHRMRGAAAVFDRRLCAGLAESDTTRLAELLDRLEANVSESAEPKIGRPDHRVPERPWS